MSAGILVSLAIQWAAQHQRDKTCLDLGILPSNVKLGPNGHVVSRGSKKNHGTIMLEVDGAIVTGSTVESKILGGTTRGRTLRKGDSDSE